MPVPTDPVSLRFAARITIAAMTAYLIAEALALPEALWAVITALIVVQTSVGGTIGTGFDRLVGTLAGAVIGGVAATAHALWPILPIGPLLLVAIAPLSLFAVKRPSYRVAPVTAALMLLLVHGAEAPLVIALDRVLEIAIGCVIGIAVAILVLPYRAEQQLVDKVAAGLKLLGQQITLQLGARAPGDRARIETLQEQLRGLLASCETIAVDARREHRMHLGRRDPEPLFRTLRRLRSDVAIVDRAMTQLADAGAPPGLAAVAAAFADMLEAAAKALPRRAPPPPAATLDDALAACFGAPVPDRLLPLSIALEAVRRDCGDLIDRVAERAAEEREAA